MTTIKQPLSKIRVKAGSGPQILIVVASVTTIFISLIEMFRGALAVGISTDEPESISLLEQGINGTWDPAGYWGVLPGSIAFTKGNTFQILSHVANIVRGNESWGVFAYSAESYAVQHLVIVALAVITMAAVGLSVWLITNSFTASVFGVAVLSAMPVFIGHAMFNPKDIPTATGFTILTTGCIILLTGSQRISKPTSAKKFLAPNIWGSLFIFFGFWLGAGMRFALWLPFLLLTFFAAAIIWVTRKSKAALLAPISALAAVAAVALSHPHYLPYWDIWLRSSISNSANHTWGASLGSLVGGERMTGDSLTWWYLPAWVFGSLPLLLIGLTLLGVIVALYQVVAKQTELSQKSVRLLVLAQAFGLPLASVVTGAIMYNAQRLHMYMFPALAVLAGLGFKWLFSAASAHKNLRTRRIWQWVIAGTGAFALLYPTLERLQLHPYQYTYLNEVATIGGINDRWETDYYNASLREAITRLPTDVYPYFFGPPENMDTYFYLRGLNHDPNNVAAEDEYWRINVTVSGRTMPGNCRDVDSVTRNFRGEDVVMSWVGICKELPGGRSENQ